MSRKKKAEKPFIEGVIKPLLIALMIALFAAIFIWAVTSFNQVSILLVILYFVIRVGLAGLMVFLFYRLVKGMREGKSYTVFRTNTPVKRFFEYVFVTVFTLGIGLLLIATVINDVVELSKVGGW